jgi:hypothetical protein
MLSSKAGWSGGAQHASPSLSAVLTVSATGVAVIGWVVKGAQWVQLAASTASPNDRRHLSWRDVVARRDVARRGDLEDRGHQIGRGGEMVSAAHGQHLIPDIEKKQRRQPATSFFRSAE